MTMISKSPRDQVVGPLPNAGNPWLINGVDPNYLSTIVPLKESHDSGQIIIFHQPRFP